MNPDVTIVLSGPKQRQPQLLKTLESEGVHLAEPSSHGLPDDGSFAWITALAEDVDHVAGIAEKAGWNLRLHWSTPKCGKCVGSGQHNGDDCDECNGHGLSNRKPEKAPSALDWLTGQGVTPAEFRKWMEG